MKGWIKVEDGCKCFFCGKIYSIKGIGTHIWRNHGDGQLFNPNIGYKNGNRQAWNKGLSKETDKRMMKISESVKASVIKSPPKMRKFGSSSTLEKELNRRQKISDSRRKYLLDIETKKGFGFSHVKWYEVKNYFDKKLYNVHGTLERDFAEWLYSNKIGWQRTYLQYEDNGLNRNYLPDFYLPDFNLYIETKGFYSNIDQEKMRLVLEQNDIDLIVLFHKHIKKLYKFYTIEEIKVLSKI